MRCWGWVGALALAVGLLCGARPAEAQTNVVYSTANVTSGGLNGTINVVRFDGTQETWSTPMRTLSLTKGTPLLEIVGRYEAEVWDNTGSGSGSGQWIHQFTVAGSVHQFAQAYTYSYVTLQPGTDLYTHSATFDISAVTTTVDLGEEGLLDISLPARSIVLSGGGRGAGGSGAAANVESTLLLRDAPSAVPEPGSILLFLPALAVVGVLKRRRGV